MDLDKIEMRESLEIPYEELDSYACMLCDSSLADVARAGCLGIWKRRLCNKEGNGRLRKWHKEKVAAR